MTDKYSLFLELKLDHNLYLDQQHFLRRGFWEADIAGYNKISVVIILTENMSASVDIFISLGCGVDLSVYVLFNFYNSLFLHLCG